MKRCIAIAILALLPLVANAQFGPAVIKGKKFYNSATGQYLPIKGIDYYPRPNTGPLALGNSQDMFNATFESRWTEDIAEWQALGVNVVRLYAVEPGQNHDGFMNALKDAGIYVMVSLAADCLNCAIQSATPPDCYPETLKRRGYFIISEFAKYENVLGFAAGNEVGLVGPAGEPEFNGPCQKKFVRDMRAFIAGCPGLRSIPVGVVSADTDRDLNSPYYNCRSDPDDELENAEWYGINSYVWCGDPGVTDPQNITGFQSLLGSFQSYELTIPVMLTEFGCINPRFPAIGDWEAQRDFLQVTTMHSPNYRQEFAGGMVFEYSTEFVNSGQDANYPPKAYHPGNYGVGYFSPIDCNHLDVPCDYVRMPQFATLASRYNFTITSEPNMANYVPPYTTIPTCPVNFPPLSSYAWPTDSIDPPDCPYNSGSAPTSSSATPAPTPPVAATTPAPSTLAGNTMPTSPTRPPTAPATSAPTTTLPVMSPAPLSPSSSNPFGSSTLTSPPTAAPISRSTPSPVFGGTAVVNGTATGSVSPAMPETGIPSGDDEPTLAPNGSSGDRDTDTDSVTTSASTIAINIHFWAGLILLTVLYATL